MQQGPPGYGPPPGGGYGAPPGAGGYGPPPGGYGAPPGGQPPQGGYAPPPPKKKGMSGLTIALIVIGTLAVLGFGSCAVCVGLGAYAGSTSTAAASHPAPTVVDIHTLLKEYKDNEVRADTSYKSKWIQTDALVKDVKKDMFDQPYLLLGTGAYFEIPQLQCRLDDKNAKTAAALSKGTQVTVVGKVKGLSFNVQMENCQITAISK